MDQENKRAGVLEMHGMDLVLYSYIISQPRADNSILWSIPRYVCVCEGYYLHKHCVSMVGAASIYISVYTILYIYTKKQLESAS